MGSLAGADVVARATLARVASRPPLVCWFEDCRRDAGPLVGGKCASLGELINAGARVQTAAALPTAGHSGCPSDW